jgi:hypothetical protein
MNPATITQALTVNGNVLATSYITSGGTSSQFVKGDGSLDSSTYLTTTSAASIYVPKTRTISINGSSLDLTTDIAFTVGTVTGSGTGTRVAFWSGTGSNLTSNAALYWDNTNLRLGVGVSPTVSLDVSGAGKFTSSITASSIIKSGGTSSQFLKADGSIDSTAYGTGTFTLPSLTSGSVLFSNGTTIVQDNSAFFWNNTSKALGVGTQPTAGYVLHAYAVSNANAWAIIENPKATGATALFLKSDSFFVAGFQYDEATNITQVFANYGNLKLTSGGNNGITIADSTGAATFSSSVTAGSSSATNYATLQIMGASTSPSLTVGTAANVVFAMAAGQELAITANGTAPYGVNFQARNSLAGGGGSGTSYPIIFNPLGGDVAIGTSTPLSKLTVWTPTTQSNAGVWSNCEIALHNSTSVGDYSQIGLGYAVGTTNAAAYIGLKSTSAAANGKGDLVFGTRDVTTDTAATERLVIASTGNVAIGRNPESNVRLSVTGSDATSSNFALYVRSSGGTLLSVRNDGAINITDSYFLANSAGGYRFNNQANTFNNVIMYDNGNVSIRGALSKGSGSFRIDHPLESMTETHQLVHSFIEGPKADLIYRGKLTLINGKAQANIDEVSTMTEGTFNLLCRDVQCFTTNESGWDLVKGKVIANIIYIESQNTNSTDEISWMVIGERKDKHMMDTEWTDINGKVIVEPLKPIETKL